MGRGDRRDPLALGDVVNIAARAQSLAGPGHRRHHGHHAATRRGHVRGRVAGAPEHQRRHQAARAAPGHRCQGGSRLAGVASSTGRRFVGRRNELAVLDAHWARARDGSGQVVHISGEPGIGKSRLVDEFRHGLAGEDHVWLECGGTPHRQHTPFATLARDDRAGVRLETGRPDRGSPRRPRCRALAWRASIPRRSAPLLAPVLGLTPDPGRYPVELRSAGQQREDLPGAMVQWLLAVARDRPLVVLTEDLHWLDPSSLELLDLMVKAIASAPGAHDPDRATRIRVAAHVGRPPFVARRRPARPRRGHRARGRARARRTERRPTSPRSPSGRMASRCFSRRCCAPPARTARTRSPPCRRRCATPSRLVSTGWASRRPSPRSRRCWAWSSRSRSSPRSPTSTSRRCAPGSTGSWRTTSPARVAPGATANHRFTHALLQETAYASLLRARRQELHGRVADVLSARRPAHRRSPSGAAGPSPHRGGAHPEAVGEWERAFGQAFAASALVEAEAHLDTRDRSPDATSRRRRARRDRDAPADPARTRVQRDPRDRVGSDPFELRPRDGARRLARRPVPADRDAVRRVGWCVLPR